MKRLKTFIAQPCCCRSKKSSNIGVSFLLYLLCR